MHPPNDHLPEMRQVVRVRKHQERTQNERCVVEGGEKSVGVEVLKQSEGYRVKFGDVHLGMTPSRRPVNLLNASRGEFRLGVGGNG